MINSEAGKEIPILNTVCAPARALYAPSLGRGQIMEFILFYGNSKAYRVHRIESFDFKNAKFLAEEFLLTKKKSENNGEALDCYLCADIGEWIRV